MSSAQPGDDLPVTNVTWRECDAFCRRLTEHAEQRAGRISAGVHYDLPSEAQWEYACRAGSSGLFAGKLDDMGWFVGNSFVGDYQEGETHTHRVALKQPNAWGFYDMHGNVYEYCADEFGWYSSEALVDPQAPTGKASVAEPDPDRVRRGGSWACPPACCTSAARDACGANVRRHYMGFRVARSAP
ncbi:MAG: formylglycine-generating enzyme family protein [Planctomycetota bacterium]